MFMPTFLAWHIHESRRLRMRGAEGEAVRPVLRTLRNKTDAAGSARPEGKNAGFLRRTFGNRMRNLFIRDIADIA